MDHIMQHLRASFAIIIFILGAFHTTHASDADFIDNLQTANGNIEQAARMSGISVDYARQLYIAYGRMLYIQYRGGLSPADQRDGDIYFLGAAGQQPKPSQITNVIETIKKLQATREEEDRRIRLVTDPATMNNYTPAERFAAYAILTSRDSTTFQRTPTRDLARELSNDLNMRITVGMLDNPWKTFLDRNELLLPALEAQWETINAYLDASAMDPELKAFAREALTTLRDGKPPAINILAAEYGIGIKEATALIAQIRKQTDTQKITLDALIAAQKALAHTPQLTIPPTVPALPPPANPADWYMNNYSHAYPGVRQTQPFITNPTLYMTSPYFMQTSPVKPLGLITSSGADLRTPARIAPPRPPTGR